MIRGATPEDAEAIARVHVAAWAETYADLVPPEALARWTVPMRTEQWHAALRCSPSAPQRSEVAVLDLDGAVQGFASWCEQRDEELLGKGLGGEVSAIYLLRAAQGRGHGRALMARAARALLARGHAGASVWVLRDNRRACTFYERLGGAPTAGKVDTLAGQPVVEVAYAWPSLASSLSAITSTASATIGVGSRQ